MLSNVEIKARIADFQVIAKKVAVIADKGPIEIKQDDTFFHCETGRLKLRSFSNTHGELIYYKRENQTGPKESFYIRHETDHPDTLRETLSLACGVVGRIRKQRTLYLVNRTRVHLDKVEGLGDFLELEVVLKEGESAQAGIEVANLLMEQLGVKPSQLVENSYIDLIGNKTDSGTK